MNIQELRKADAGRGWSAIPSECPANFVEQICELRATSIATGRPIPSARFFEPVARRVRSAAEEIKRISRVTGKCFEDLLSLPIRRSKGVPAHRSANWTNEYTVIARRKAERQAREIAAERARRQPPTTEELRRELDRQAEEIHGTNKRTEIQRILWS